MIKLKIFTEGGKDKGFGHISRCISIAEALNEIIPSIDICFYLNSDNSVESIIPEYFNIVYLDFTSSNQISDDYISKTDIVIIDSYEANQEFYNNVSTQAGLAAYIDDFKRIDYPQGIIINGSIGAEKLDYKIGKNTEILVGAEYAYIRKEFTESERLKTNPNLLTILVSFGANDFRGLTIPVLQMLKKFDFNTIVLLTDAMSNIEEIKSLEDEKTCIRINANAQQIRDDMLFCDAGIIAAGQTLFEAVITGLPVISVMIVDNQVNNVKFFNEKDLILHAGNYDDPHLLEKIDTRINEIRSFDIRKDLCERMKKSMDGKGPKRISKKLLNSYFTKYLLISPANEDDIETVYKLACQKTVRQNSYNQKQIEYDEHKRWFKNILSSDKEILLCAKINTNLAGQVRFSLNDKSAIIGISIDENLHGFGLGKIVLGKAIEHLKKKHPYTQEIFAYVKKTNLVSEKLFLALGFEIVCEELVKGVKSYVFKIELTQPKMS